MRWLAIISDSSNNLIGGQICSNILSYIKHGDPNVRAIVENLFIDSIKPLLNFIKKFMQDGDIYDP